ncbi:hypothetical protein AcetOrient_orf01617 [Acetobacter orientalis]|uniref:Uncharacterized protein n=1 Tax=Acetobacter orientalis TaxID=146474 RepID=A0A2Z5ZGY6_9PROT|nr:hypothetical protein AcetOrient_orf01617 [Acetobacter orientalis]
MWCYSRVAARSPLGGKKAQLALNIEFLNNLSANPKTE